MSRFFRLFFFGLTLVSLGLISAANAQDAKTGIDAKTAFEKMKALAGDWKSAPAGEHTQHIAYKVISSGSVVMETYFPGTDHEMVSMYHLDGDELRVVHYCAARNQPHLKLDKKASTESKLVFAFDGGTNFDPAKDAHMHEGYINVTGKDRLTAEWQGWADGKFVHAEKFELTRK